MKKSLTNLVELYKTIKQAFLCIMDPQRNEVYDCSKNLHKFSLSIQPENKCQICGITLFEARWNIYVKNNANKHWQKPDKINMN